MNKRHRLPRLTSAEGAYFPDAFSIRIESDPPLIDPASLTLRTDDPEDFSTMVHEYWHYLQNLSTVAGFGSFELFHDLAARFHQTLVQHGDGRSVGSAPLDAAHQQAVRELTEILDARAGQDCPTGIDPQQVESFEVLDAVADDYALTRNGHDVPLTRVRLHVRVQAIGAAAVEADMLFGSTCIEEGIAYEVDRMVAGGGAGSPAGDNAPMFPYFVLRELARFRSTVDIHRIDLIALATLATLTTDPAGNFLDLLDDFGTRRTAGETVQQALDGIWQDVRPHYQQVFDVIAAHDLPSIVTMYQGRGLLQHAAEYIAENCLAVLRRRLADPFFDIRPFTRDRLDRPSLESLFREVLPCDTIQSFPGGEHAVARDLLVTFGVPSDRWTHLGYRPSDFLRTMECQVNYLFCHLGDDQFLPSAVVESRCPYYTVCTLPFRRDHSNVCRESPWLSYLPGERFHCWYGTAVASTLGVTVIRSRFGDPGIPDRERAALHAAVEKRAYEIWEEAGRRHGYDRADWFRAKAELGIADDIYV